MALEARTAGRRGLWRNSWSSRDLPMPASPAMPTTCPWPRTADSSRLRRRSSSWSAADEAAMRRPAEARPPARAQRGGGGSAPGLSPSGARSKRRSRKGAAAAAHDDGARLPPRPAARRARPATGRLASESIVRASGSAPEQDVRRGRCRSGRPGPGPRGRALDGPLRSRPRRAPPGAAASSIGSSPKARRCRRAQLLDTPAEAPRLVDDGLEHARGSAPDARPQPGRRSTQPPRSSGSPALRGRWRRGGGGDAALAARRGAGGAGAGGAGAAARGRRSVTQAVASPCGSAACCARCRGCAAARETFQPVCLERLVSR